MKNEKPRLLIVDDDTGIHRFDPEAPGEATLHNASGDGHTIADALWLLPVE